MSVMTNNTSDSGVLTKSSDPNADPQLRDALKDRIQQLEKEKLAEPDFVRKRMRDLRAKVNGLAEDDENFLLVLTEGWIDHNKKIKTLESSLQTTQRKAETLGNLSKKLSEKNKQLTKMREEMQGQVDKGLSDVKSKISLYEEENSNIVAENNNLRAALKKAMEYNSKRGEHIKVLQTTNDFLREKHDEMDKKYSQICAEYQNRLEEVTAEHGNLKKKFQDRCLENVQLKEAVKLLNAKNKQDKETRELVAEFEEKYKKLLDDSNECIQKYKLCNEKLTKSNATIKTQASQARIKLEKCKAENKDLKKKSHKLDKKVSTLTRLCRELQQKNKELTTQENPSTAV